MARGSYLLDANGAPLSTLAEAPSPTLARGANVITLVNSNLAAASSRFASADTGRTTSLPASLGALTATLNSFWAAVS